MIADGTQKNENQPKTVNMPGPNATFINYAEHYTEVKIPQSPATCLPQAWNLPAVNPNFFMREVFEEISKTLIEQKSGQPLILVAVSGLGGIGKTELARQYIHTSQKNYNAKLWIHACSKTELIQEYRLLAQALCLGVDERTDPEGKLVIREICSFLAAHPGWLLVVDNADDTTLAPSLPTSGGDVLVTSRQPQWEGKIIEVNVLSEEEAIQFYQKLNERAAADPHIATLVSALGFLPLAIAQAAAYVKNSGGITVEAYLTEFNNYRAFMLQNNALPATTQEERNRLTIMTTWNLSLDAIEKHHSINAKYLPFCAKTLLIQVAFLASFGIPKSLLQRIVTQNFPQAPASITLNKAIEELSSHSLIQHDATFVHVHSLVQEVIRIQNPLNQTCFETIAKALYDEAPPARYIQMHEINRIIKLIPHGEALLQYHDKFRPPISLSALERLLLCLQNQYGAQANYSARKITLERLLPIVRQIYGRSTREETGLLNNLGATLQGLGDMTGAKNTLQDALDSYKRLNASDDIEGARILANLANVLNVLGDSRSARNMLQSALNIHELCFGNNNIEITHVLGTFGMVLNDLGEYQKARDILQRALDIEESFYKPDHIRVGITLTSLAIVLSGLGDYLGAQRMLHRSRGIKEHYYGPKHIKMAITLNCLAEIAALLGDTTSAWNLYQSVLTINEHHYGSAHPEVARSQGNLARMCCNFGDKAAQAQDLIREALTKVERFPGYGTTHAWYKTLQDTKRLVEFVELALQRGVRPPPVVASSNTIKKILLAAEKKSLQGHYEDALADYQELRKILDRQQSTDTDLLLFVDTACDRTKQSFDAAKMARVSSSTVNISSTINSLRADTPQIDTSLAKVPMLPQYNQPTSTSSSSSSSSSSAAALTQEGSRPEKK